MSFKNLVFIILVAVLSAVYAGCEAAKAAKEEGAEAVQATPRVKVAPVKTKPMFGGVSFTGTMEPNERINILPDMPGRIKEIKVKEGDFVKKGQLICRLDTRAASLQHDQAKAAVAMAEANANTASQSYERMKGLFESGSIPKQQFEQVELGYQAASAQLEQAKAVLALAQYQLNVSAVYAPFSGIISYKGVINEDIINPMMMSMGPKPNAIVTLVDISKVKAVGSVPESDAVKLKAGMNSLLTVDSLPDMRFEGTLDFVSPVADAMSRTFDVKVVFDNPEELLKGGMYARVQIVTDKSEDGAVIPRSAILSENGQEYVFTASPEGVARKRVVKTGIVQDGAVEIKEGVAPGESVIVDGNFGLRDGGKIEILKN